MQTLPGKPPPSTQTCSEAASETLSLPCPSLPPPRQPYFYKLMKRKWLNNSEAFSAIMALLAEHAQRLRRMKLEPYQVRAGGKELPGAPETLLSSKSFPRCHQRLASGPGWASRKAHVHPGWASSGLPHRGWSEGARAALSQQLVPCGSQFPSVPETPWRAGREALTCPVPKRNQAAPKPPRPSWVVSSDPAVA